MSNRIIKIILISFVLAGCVRHASAGVLSPIQPAGVDTLKETMTPLTLVPTPEATSIPTIGKDRNDEYFLKAKVISTGYFTDQVFTVVIEADRQIKGNYRAELDSEKYECIGQELFPKRLYCSGNPVENRIDPTLTIVSAKNGWEVFRIKLLLQEVK